MKWKHLASSIIPSMALILCLNCNPNNKANEEKPKLEQTIEEESKYDKKAEYFRSFRTTSNEIPSEEPCFSKEINEEYNQKHYYEINEQAGSKTILNVKYYKPNPNSLFDIEANKNGITYTFSYKPDYEWLKIENPNGNIYFYLSNDGLITILDMRDKKINKVSFWAGLDIYYGAIDDKYYDWENKDPAIQEKFGNMAKTYMEEVFSPAKEIIHCKEILYIHKHIN